MQNVLITGGLGYIGSHIAAELLLSGYNVVIADNLSNSNLAVKARIEQLCGKEISFYEGDVRCGSFLDEIFNKHQISAVLHLAGFKSVGESVREPLKYYNNNVGSAVAVLAAMQRHSVESIIFSSSATVYGAPLQNPVSEDSPVQAATNPYGQTKITIELLIKDIARSNPRFRAVILRYFNPVGAHSSYLIGENPKTTPTNLMPLLCLAALGKSELLVFGNDYATEDGSCVRDYLHITDLAKGHCAALRKLGISSDCQNSAQNLFIYNLGTGKGYSVFQMIAAFERANGVEVRFKIHTRRAGDVASIYTNPARALAELDWRAEHSLEQMCQDSFIFATKNL